MSLSRAARPARPPRPAARAPHPQPGTSAPPPGIFSPRPFGSAAPASPRCCGDCAGGVGCRALHTDPHAQSRSPAGSRRRALGALVGTADPGRGRGLAAGRTDFSAPALNVRTWRSGETGRRKCPGHRPLRLASVLRLRAPRRPDLRVAHAQVAAPVPRDALACEAMVPDADALRTRVCGNCESFELYILG